MWLAGKRTPQRTVGLGDNLGKLGKPWGGPAKEVFTCLYTYMLQLYCTHKLQNKHELRIIHLQSQSFLATVYAFEIPYSSSVNLLPTCHQQINLYNAELGMSALCCVQRKDKPFIIGFGVKDKGYRQSNPGYLPRYLGTYLGRVGILKVCGEMNHLQGHHAFQTLG